MSDTTLLTTGELLPPKHDVSREFQRFLDSAAVRLDVFSDTVFESTTYCAAVVLCTMQFSF